MCVCVCVSVCVCVVAVSVLEWGQLMNPPTIYINMMDESHLWSMTPQMVPGYNFNHYNYYTDLKCSLSLSLSLLHTHTLSLSQTSCRKQQN